MLSGTGRHRRRSNSRATRLIAAAGVAGVGVAMPIIGAGTAQAASVSTWDKVAQCESTSNWKINTGNGFYGGLQFTASTWNEFGGSQYASRADLATKAQQIAIAEKVLKVQGPGAWPVCSVKAGLTRGGATPNIDTSSSSGATTTKTTPKKATSAPKAKASTQQKATPAPAPKSEAPKATTKPRTETVAKTTPKTTTKTTTGKAAVEAAPKAGSAEASSYVVVSGDTLSKIANARQVPGGWPKLYEANKSVVGGDPDLIYPGQKLAVSGTSTATPKAAPKATTTKTEASTKTSTTKTAPKASAKSEVKTETTKKSSTTKSSTAKSSTSTTKSSGNYVRPVSGGSLSASYGQSGSRWSSGSHTGQDFAVSTGTTVRAVTSGTVVSAGWGGAYGNEVVIRHSDGKYTQYAHLSSISVKAGMKVQTGQKIALSGATGNVSGPHLHFEVRTTPNYGSAINPASWLRAHGVSV